MKKIVLLLIPVLMLLIVSAKNSMEADPPFLLKSYLIAAVHDPVLDAGQVPSDEPGKTDAARTAEHLVEQERTETAVAEFYPSGTGIFFTLYL